MWFIIGIILGTALLGLILYIRSRNISLKWHEWLIGVIGLLLLLFTVQNFLGALAEVESTAAWMSLLVFGLPALTLMIVSWQLAAKRRRESQS